MARLQFRHLEEAFANREDAVSYIKHLTDSQHVLSQSFSESLIGEPIVVKYTDENDKEQVILAIGVEGNKGESKLVDYHIIDSAFLNESISELSGMTDDIRDMIDVILAELGELDNRVDNVESGLTEIRDLIETITSGTIKSIEINMDDQWEGSGSGTSANIENGVAKITLTTDNVRVADEYEGQLIHHDHSLTEFIASVEGIHIEKIESGLSANVKEEYRLVDGENNPMGNETIKIYKDSSLYSTYLGHVDDALTSAGDPTVVPGTGDTALCFIYQKADGTYELVAINVEEFLQESEFEDGLDVNNHIVKVKIDATSEPYLTVSPDGVKLSGIDNIANNLNELSAVTVSELDNVKDSISDNYDDLNSKINTEIERAISVEEGIQENINELDDRITAITGQEGNEYKKHNTTPDDNANYINVAESMDNADFILDQKLGELSAETISEIERLDTKIDNASSAINSQIQQVSETLEDEIERATATDTALAEAIDGEAETRANADNALDARLDVLEGKTISGVDAINIAESGSNTSISLLINSEDKMLSQNVLGIKSTVSIDILKENDKDYILLKGINGQEISRVDATAFIKDGMLDSVEWIPNSNILQFTFNTDAGKEVINIDFAQFVNDEVNRQIAVLSGAVATINGDVNTANSTYYKIDDVLVKYNVAGSAVDAAHSLIRYYVDAEGHKYYVSSNAKDMYYSGECLETVITNILSDMTTVKEKTEEMEDDVNEVKETIYEIRDDMHDLSEELLREIQRATSAETGLHNEITNEANARQHEDDLLWSAITASSGSISDISARLVQEIERATSAETILQNNIDNEAQEREQADNEILSALTQEIERATARENEIENKLLTDVEYDSSAKTIDFYDAEHNLIDSIDATDFIKDGMVDNVVIENNKLIITFNTDAGKETIEIPLTDIFNPDNYYTKDEVDTFIENIESAITIEAEARANADSTLQDNIDAEAQAREEEDNEIWSAITNNNSEISDLSDRLEQEIERATSAETILQNNIDAEADAREQEDLEIWSAITELETVVVEEITSAITVLQENIEENYYTKEEINEFVENIESSITIETEARTAEDEAIWSALTQEIERATSAETVLQNNIDAEADAREEEDNEIWSAITEVTENITNNYYPKSEIDTKVGALFASVNYDSSAKTIDFYNGNNELLDSIDATDFIKDGMVDNVFISGNSLMIVFNTDAGKETIEIPLTDIFNPANYYTKDEVDTFIENIESAITIETERALAEEAAIWSAMTQGTGSLSELREMIEREIERATSAETILQENIDAEEERATSAETILQNNIDAEAQAREEEDNKIWSAITELSSTTINLDERVTELENTPGIAYVEINGEQHYTVTSGSGNENYVDLGDGYLTTEDVITTVAEYSALTQSGSLIDAYVIKQVIDDNERVTSEALNNLNDRVDANASAITIVTENVANNYYDKGEVDDFNETFFTSVDYITSGNSKYLCFYNGDNELLDSVDAAEFIKDGMVDNVAVSGTDLVIVFNTDAGKEDIVIPLSSIFNPDNYYTKSEINDIVEDIESAITIEAEARAAEDEDIWSALTIETEERAEEDEEIWSAITEVRQIISDNEFVIASAFNDLNDRVSDLEDEIETKQDTLVSGINIKTINNQSLLGDGNITIEGGGSGHTYSAGNNIDITNDVISVTGISVPTSNTAFTNDANYITSAFTDSNYYTKSTIDTMFTQISGVFMKVTSAQYAEMEQQGTLDPDILYVIID